MQSSIEVKIEDRTHIGEARRVAARMTEDAGFDSVQSGRAALITAEAASNILKHAERGMLFLRIADLPERSTFEIIALDHGAGIRDPRSSMTDGVSTSGTPGTGLGAIRRSADLFDLYSKEGVGTILLAQVDGSTRESAEFGPHERPNLESGAVCLAKPGEEVSGDSWDIVQRPNAIRVAVIDGLGHGPEARIASSEGVKAFRNGARESISEVLQRMHVALRPTRGAAAGIAEIDLEALRVSFVGVGNIAAMVATPMSVQRMVSHNGIVGHEMRKVQEYRYEWRRGAVLILQSDGLSTHWDAAKYPALLSAHPSIISAVLLRDLSRGRDDSTAVAVSGWSSA